MVKEIAAVISVREIAANIWEAVLSSPKISAQAQPGQFVNILPSADWSKTWRRPMSLASQGNEQISIIFRVVGEGTQILSRWNPGDKIDIIGPLGNYWQGFTDGLPILIAGGTGLAPILNLHHTLNAQGRDHYLIIGARTAKEHFSDHQPQTKILLTTDDGTLGFEGNVLVALNKILPNLPESISPKIFSCGPSPMLNAVKLISQKHNFKCYLALESLMACGIGLCQGCAVEQNNDDPERHSHRQKFALVCSDGPIFDAEEIKCV